jgi:hypothetical protein
MDRDFYDNLFENNNVPEVSLGDILTIPIILIALGNIFYSAMLLLKFKVLSDTVESYGKNKMKNLIYFNIIVSVIAGVIGTFLIILG